MNKALIGLLVCVNLALLATLIFGVGADEAKAQTGFYRTNYALMTVRMQESRDAVYVMDLATQRMFACSSKRALISTITTTCLPASAASISASTIGLPCVR